MNIYEELGLNRVINGSGKMTALGVSKISDSVANTMKEAGQNFVVIDELFDKAGELISKVTGGEDTCVTSSASAGIALSVAGVITGMNLSLVEKLPETNGVKKVILQKGHAVNYGAPVNTMIRLGGGTPVEIGQSNQTTIEQLREEIDSDTVALVYIKSHHCVQKGMLSLEEMAVVAREYKLPLIVDAAAEEDLTIYLEKGADLVIYSGAKALCGPASGFVTGKKELIDAIKLQYKGIGRAMKVGKTGIMGLVKAVEEYSNRSEQEVVRHQKELVTLLMKSLEGEDVDTRMVQDEAGREIYRTEVRLKDNVAITGKEFLKKLSQGPVEVHVRKHYANLGIVNVDMRALTREDIDIVANKIKDILK